MKKRRERRAPSTDWLAMTQADRDAVRQSRVNAKSPRYRTDLMAITNGDATPTTKTSEQPK